MPSSKAKLKAEGLQKTIDKMPPSPQKTTIVAELNTLRMELGFADELNSTIRKGYPLPVGGLDFVGDAAKKQEWIDYWAAMDQHRIDTAATLPIQPKPLPIPKPAP